MLSALICDDDSFKYSLSRFLAFQALARQTEILSGATLRFAS